MGSMKFSLVPLLFLYAIASWEMISCESNMGSQARGGIESDSITPLFWRRLLEKKDNKNLALKQTEGELEKKEQTGVVEKKGKQDSIATEETEEEVNEMESELMLPDETDDQNPEDEKVTLEIEKQVDKKTQTTVVDKELKKAEQQQAKKTPEISKLKSDLEREGEFEKKTIKKGKQYENEPDKNLQSKVEKKPVTEQGADQKVLKEGANSEMVKGQEEGLTSKEIQKEGKGKEKRNTEKGALQGSTGEILEEIDEVQHKTDSESQLVKKGAESVMKDEIVSGKGKKGKKTKSKRKSEAVDGQGSAGKILETSEQVSEDRGRTKVQQKTVVESQYEENSVESELAEVDLKAKKRGKKISDSDSESDTDSEVNLQGEVEENIDLDLNSKETLESSEKEGTKVMQEKNKEKPIKENRQEKSKMVMTEEMEVKESKSDDRLSGSVTKEPMKEEKASLDSVESELLVELKNRDSRAEKNSQNKAEADSTKATQKKAKKGKPRKEKKGEEEIKVEIQAVDEGREGEESKSDGTILDLEARAKKGGKTALGRKDLYSSEEKNKAAKTVNVALQHGKKKKSFDTDIMKVNGKENKEENPLRVEEESEVEIEEKELKEPESDGAADDVRTAKKRGKKSLNSELESELVKVKGGDKVEQKFHNKAEKSLDVASQNDKKQKNADKSVTKHAKIQGEKPPREMEGSEGGFQAMDEKGQEETQEEHIKEQKAEVRSEVESQAVDEGKDMKESKKDGNRDAQQAGMVEKTVSTSAQESDDDDDEYGEFMQDFIDLPSKFQDTAQRVAGHLKPNIQKITDTSKDYLKKANRQITESFSPLVGKQYAPFLASVISYGLLLLPLAVVIILFEHIRALLSLQKVLLFVNIYLAAYFAILMLATFIIRSEPMAFFYKNATTSYIHMQLLQAFGYIVYLILQTFDVFSSCSSESVAAKVTGLVQWFVAVVVGFHYYVTVFHRAMAMKVPHTSWKIYGIYSLAFSILCLFARIKRTKKEYVQVGQVDSNKKN